MALDDKAVNLRDLKVSHDDLDGKVTDLKSDLIDPNLTNPTLVDKKFVNAETGAIYDSNSYVYIEATGISTYHKLHVYTHTTGLAGICFYKADGTYISGIGNTPTADNYLFDQDVDVPDGANIIRVSCLKTARTGLSVNTTLKTMLDGINDKLAEGKEYTDERVEEIEPIKSYFHESPNIADPDDFVVGEYVNQVTGAFESGSGHTRTGYVPVVGGQDYCIVNTTGTTNLNIRYAFYKSDKTYISGAYVELSDIDSVVTAPSNAAFLVMSATETYFPYMVAESDTAIGFETYGSAYLKSQYAPHEGGGTPSIILNLPEKIYALPGYELNVYFENITDNWEDYEWDCSCSVGMQLKRGYRVTPTGNGSYTLTITATSKYGAISTVSTTLIIASASAGSGTTKSVIVLGDSTTYSNTVIQKLNENFSSDVMSVSTLGTMGTAPNNHEGRSGWTLNDYFTKASITYPAGDPRGTIYNPFYNPSTQTFDADYYFTNSGVSKPDWFFINMGINDMFSCTSDSALATQITTCIGYLNSMITSIKSASPNTKIGICVTIPPNASQDAFGKAYACGQTRDRYKRNNAIWAGKIIEEFDGGESNNVYVIPIHTNLDTVWNMGMESDPVNARNPSVTYESPIGNGGVHPVESGYWQIADVYTAFLKGNT